MTDPLDYDTCLALARAWDEVEEAPATGRTCRCGHPKSLHHRGGGECVALLTSGWSFCSCKSWEEAAPEASEG